MNERDRGMVGVLAAMMIIACDGSGGARDAPMADGGGSDAPIPIDAPALDAPSADDAPAMGTDAPGTDAPATVELVPCPTSGDGAIEAPADCFAFSPEDAGAPPGGVNGEENHYALAPSGTPRGRLVVYMVGSLGTPAVSVRDPVANVYTTLAAAGFHVISLSYRSAAIVGMVCAGETACFGPTRRALITGEHQTGEASTGLSDLRGDEGILDRLDRALAHLVAGDPGGGWDAYVRPGARPEDRIAWSEIITAGHSQGGGHAAYLGRMFELARVVQLSSTCDGVSDASPAAWTTEPELFATDTATRYVGFAAATDTTLCGPHAAVWEAMGLDPSRRFDDATVCGDSGGAHGCTVACEENLARLPGMFTE